MPIKKHLNKNQRRVKKYNQVCLVIQSLVTKCSWSHFYRNNFNKLRSQWVQYVCYIPSWNCYIDECHMFYMFFPLLFSFINNYYWSKFLLSSIIRFDEYVKNVELDYPRDMVMWSGVPYSIDSAFKYNGKCLGFYVLLACGWNYNDFEWFWQRSIYVWIFGLPELHHKIPVFSQKDFYNSLRCRFVFLSFRCIFI